MTRPNWINELIETEHFSNVLVELEEHGVTRVALLKHFGNYSPLEFEVIEQVIDDAFELVKDETDWHDSGAFGWKDRLRLDWA